MEGAPTRCRAFLFLVAAFVANAAFADGTGWFTPAQTAKGRFEYAQKCAVCHGTQLQGTGGPALKGPQFVAQWNGKKLSELYNYVHKIGELYGALAQPTTSTPTQAELNAADNATTNWLMYNKGYRGERFSALKQINAANAGKLRPVCMFQLGELGTFSTGPVMYDGILYVTTHLGTYAIDATTCRNRWQHQHVPQGPEMNATNKGVALAGGRVIRGTQDGVLYALDAKARRSGREHIDTPDSMDHGGGAAWVTYALDRDTGTLFVPVGNPGPDYNNKIRPGANLFSISTVALDAIWAAIFSRSTRTAARRSTPSIPAARSRAVSLRTR